MINLIPNEEKKKKVRDFYFRLITTFFFVTGISILVASVGILPAFFLSQVRKNVTFTKFSTEKKETSISEESTLAQAKELDKKLALTEKVSEHYLLSEKVIGTIISYKSSDIKITTISFNEDNKGKIISIGGVALSREKLLVFKKALEGDKSFRKVELPISNFVKGTDIPFSITITPV